MNYKKYIKKVELTPAEKKHMRGVVIKLMNNEPVRIHPFSRPLFREGAKNIFLLIIHSKPMLASIIAAVLVAFSGGAAAAAENSLPGDWLYPIKTKVNEEVRAVFALTPEAKVAWETRRAERRLEESETMVAQNTLTTSTATMLAERFDRFSVRAEAKLAKLRANNQLTDEQTEKLRDNFEAAIKAHDEILARLQTRLHASIPLKTLVDSVRERVSSTIKLRIEREIKLIEESNTTTLKIVAENRRMAANNKLAEVEKFININTNKVSQENKLTATTKLTEAKNMLTNGDQLYERTQYGEAILQYSAAHREAQEAKKYLTKNFRWMPRSNTTSDSTPTTTASNTFKFNIQNKQQTIAEAREDLKILEQKLRAEIRNARTKQTAAPTQ